QAGPQSVDRHPHLAPEAGRKWERGGTSTLAQIPLARERLFGRPPRAEADKQAGCPLREPDTTSDSARERRDGEVGVGLREATERAAEIGVAEEQRARGSRPLRRRERLALAEAAESDDDCPRFLRTVRGRVAGCPVGDEDLGTRECIPQGADGLCDPL